MQKTHAWVLVWGLLLALKAPDPTRGEKGSPGFRRMPSKIARVAAGRGWADTCPGAEGVEVPEEASRPVASATGDKRPRA